MGMAIPDITVANQQKTSFVCFNNGNDMENAASYGDGGAIADFGIQRQRRNCLSHFWSLVYFNDGKWIYRRAAGFRRTRELAVMADEVEMYLDLAACRRCWALVYAAAMLRNTC